MRAALCWVVFAVVCVSPSPPLSSPLSSLFVVFSRPPPLPPLLSLSRVPLHSVPGGCRLALASCSSTFACGCSAGPGPRSFLCGVFLPAGRPRSPSSAGLRVAPRRGLPGPSSPACATPPLPPQRVCPRARAPSRGGRGQREHCPCGASAAADLRRRTAGGARVRPVASSFWFGLGRPACAAAAAALPSPARPPPFCARHAPRLTHPSPRAAAWHAPVHFVFSSFPFLCPAFSLYSVSLSHPLLPPAPVPFHPCSLPMASRAGLRVPFMARPPPRPWAGSRSSGALCGLPAPRAGPLWPPAWVFGRPCPPAVRQCLPLPQVPSPSAPGRVRPLPPGPPAFPCISLSISYLSSLYFPISPLPVVPSPFCLPGPGHLRRLLLLSPPAFPSPVPVSFCPVPLPPGYFRRGGHRHASAPRARGGGGPLPPPPPVAPFSFLLFRHARAPCFRCFAWRGLLFPCFSAPACLCSTPLPGPLAPAPVPPPPWARVPLRLSLSFCLPLFVPCPAIPVVSALSLFPLLSWLRLCPWPVRRRSGARPLAFAPLPSPFFSPRPRWSARPRPSRARFATSASFSLPALSRRPWRFFSVFPSSSASPFFFLSFSVSSSFFRGPVGRPPCLRPPCSSFLPLGALSPGQRGACCGLESCPSSSLCSCLPRPRLRAWPAHMRLCPCGFPLGPSPGATLAGRVLYSVRAGGFPLLLSASLGHSPPPPPAAALKSACRCRAGLFGFSACPAPPQPPARISLRSPAVAWPFRCLPAGDFPDPSPFPAVTAPRPAPALARRPGTVPPYYAPPLPSSLPSPRARILGACPGVPFPWSGPPPLLPCCCPARVICWGWGWGCCRWAALLCVRLGSVRAAFSGLRPPFVTFPPPGRPGGPPRGAVPSLPSPLLVLRPSLRASGCSFPLAPRSFPRLRFPPLLCRWLLPLPAGPPSPPFLLRHPVSSVLRLPPTPSSAGCRSGGASARCVRLRAVPWAAGRAVALFGFGGPRPAASRVVPLWLCGRGGSGRRPRRWVPPPVGLPRPAGSGPPGLVVVVTGALAPLASWRRPGRPFPSPSSPRLSSPPSSFLAACLPDAAAAPDLHPSPPSLLLLPASLPLAWSSRASLHFPSPPPFASVAGVFRSLPRVWSCAPVFPLCCPSFTAPVLSRFFPNFLSPASAFPPLPVPGCCLSVLCNTPLPAALNWRASPPLPPALRCLLAFPFFLPPASSRPPLLRGFSAPAFRCRPPAGPPAPLSPASRPTVLSTLVCQPCPPFTLYLRLHVFLPLTVFFPLSTRLVPGQPAARHSPACCARALLVCAFPPPLPPIGWRGRPPRLRPLLRGTRVGPALLTLAPPPPSIPSRACPVARAPVGRRARRGPLPPPSRVGAAAGSARACLPPCSPALACVPISAPTGSAVRPRHYCFPAEPCLPPPPWLCPVPPAPVALPPPSRPHHAAAGGPGPVPAAAVAPPLPPSRSRRPGRASFPAPPGPVLLAGLPVSPLPFPFRVFPLSATAPVPFASSSCHRPLLPPGCVVFFRLTLSFPWLRSRGLSPRACGFHSSLVWFL
ncbi:unnamed protein product [Pleuronectes platessa]|uniref:Uncharacterized protein n=1 Tax=Pleuronectes platessa TaxID=8262 RepID=A0A9N7USL7_PLEPL|nr:unnamed protein product [Pleuronectes platessa]